MKDERHTRSSRRSSNLSLKVNVGLTDTETSKCLGMILVQIRSAFCHVHRCTQVDWQLFATGIHVFWSPGPMAQHHRRLCPGLDTPERRCSCTGAGPPRCSTRAAATQVRPLCASLEHSSGGMTTTLISHSLQMITCVLSLHSIKSKCWFTLWLSPELLCQKNSCRTAGIENHAAWFSPSRAMLIANKDFRQPPDNGWGSAQAGCSPVAPVSPPTPQSRADLSTR